MKTETTIPSELLERFTAFLDSTMGLHFRKESWHLFQEKFKPAVVDFGFDNPGSCMQWLMGADLSEDQIAILARYLTVGETYFFRDANACKALEETILPSIIDAKSKQDKHIRIWSAACCTGEEPYSIAILLSLLLPDIEEWQVSILGSDINPSFLSLAKQGMFREWSFRTMPLHLKERFFQKKGRGKYQIDLDIRKMVQFRYLNLVKDNYPSLLNGTNAMDLILCNNVLIYFAESTIHNVIKKINNSLVNDGWLMVSPVEAPYVHHDHLLFSNPQNATAFQKTFHQLPSVEAVVPAVTKVSVPELKFDLAEKKTKPTSPYSPPIPDKKPLEQAQQAFEKGNYDQAISFLEKENKSLDACILLSKCCGNKGSLDEALKWCEQAISLNKVDPMLYYLKANILQELDLNQEAVEALKKSLYLDSKFTIAHMTLGNLLRRSGDLDTARRHYRNALELLKEVEEEAIIPCSEGLTAGRLRELIVTMQGVGNE